MSVQTKKATLLCISTVVAVATVLAAGWWQGRAVARSASNAPPKTVAAGQPAGGPSAAGPGKFCPSTADSCPYVYNFESTTGYTDRRDCETVGAEWCPGQVGYQCNNGQCNEGSTGQCPTAVVSVFFECYYAAGYWWLTCKCFCWVVKK